MKDYNDIDDESDYYDDFLDEDEEDYEPYTPSHSGVNLRDLVATFQNFTGTLQLFPDA